MKLITKKEQDVICNDIKEGKVISVSLHFDNGYTVKMNMKSILRLIKK